MPLVKPAPDGPATMSMAMVTTGLDFAGYRIVRTPGVVRGLV